MKFLIPTEPGDMHAVLTKIALEYMGHQVRLFFIADLPTLQKNSLFMDPQNYEWKSSDRYDSIIDNDYDVVWWRRPCKPYLPKHLSHPKDYKFIVRENVLFYEYLTSNMAPSAWWINTKEAANKARSKIFQLKLANQCGMLIPTTLCSNDPHDIHQFILKHEDAGVVYKPLCSNMWFEDQKVKLSYTSKIDFLNVSSHKLLQLTPGIFQKEIKKQYELRVTCFGNYILAAKLLSQEHHEGKVDWRAIPEGKMSVEPYQLPEKLERQIHEFMRRMGLVFGAIDFIVTPEEDYIFLEVNEQGQFLWLEEYNTEFKMLDIFIHFLLSRSICFEWDAQQVFHTIEQYREEAHHLNEQYMRNHVDLNKVC